MDNKYDNRGCNYQTDSLGTPVANDDNSLTVGASGPTLLEDIQLHNKVSHFDRERIPERVVHAKGTGAFGYFECCRCMSNYTTANFLQKPGQRVKAAVRFSTVIGSKGSADTARDPRGFAVKLYTNCGNYDIVGNHIPVFFVRDAIRFPDVIHSLKPAPHTNVRDPERFWDFVSLMPETTHMITWVYSDLGTIKDYRHVDGFSVNTFVWVNAKGKRVFIKYHWKTMQGVETIDRFEAEELAGSDPDIAVKNLHNAIACGNYPRWELNVQIIDPEEVECLDFNPLDDTKLWPEDQFPLCPVGVLTLNENPKNFFAQIEQIAFCPSNLIPGVELSADKMLQGRSFSYSDTQRYRLGTNFAQLPVNSPVSPVCNNERDGTATHCFNPEPINYSPNSLNNNRPCPYPIPVPRPKEVCGCAMRIPIENENDFKQAGEHYLSLTKSERLALCDNIAVELCKVRNDIVDRVLCYFEQANKEFACCVNSLICDYRKC